MKPAAYLDAVKRELNLPSDYALGKALELSPKTLPAIRAGTRAVPLDVAFRIAITLQLDPAQVVADLAEQRESNEARRAFWRSFMGRARTVAAAILCTLVLNFSASFGNGQAAHGGLFRRPNYA